MTDAMKNNQQVEMIAAFESDAAKRKIPVTVEGLEELYALRDELMLSKAEQRKAIIPDEVQQELDALDAEYSAREAKIALMIDDVEYALKDDVIKARQTIQGSAIQVVYTKGGQSVSAKDLMALANRWEKTNPEVAAEMKSIITIKKSSASIKPRA